MSKLHEMKIKHKNMSISEKEKCNCDLCKGLNVDKNKKKSNMKTSDQTINNNVKLMKNTYENVKDLL